MDVINVGLTVVACVGGAILLFVVACGVVSEVWDGKNE